MIEEELLLQKAKDLKIEVAGRRRHADVDRQVAQTRAQLPTETRIPQRARQGVARHARRVPQVLMDQFRRQLTARARASASSQQDGKIVPVNVTDAEVAAEFERAKPFLGPKPATVTFKQIVIAPTADGGGTRKSRA